MNTIKFKEQDVRQMIEHLLLIINDPYLNPKIKKNAYYPYMLLETEVISQTGTKFEISKEKRDGK